MNMQFCIAGQSGAESVQKSLIRKVDLEQKSLRVIYTSVMYVLTVLLN